MTWRVPPLAFTCLALAVAGASTARADDAALPPEAYLFYQACSQGDTATVASMLADTPSLATLTYPDAITPLHAAALADEPLTVELLLLHGALVDLRGGAQAVTPLFIAVVGGHGRVARVLLDHHADPNSKGSLPGSPAGADLRPLHVAALGNHADIADMLIQHGAVVSTRSLAGDTPADCARKSSSFAVAMVLGAYRTLGLAKGRAVAALIGAIAAGDSASVEHMLAKQPALANVKLEGGWTPLHLAAAAGSQPACNALLAHHADTAAEETETHWTPALRALYTGHVDLCAYLSHREGKTSPGGR